MTEPEFAELAAAQDAVAFAGQLGGLPTAGELAGWLRGRGHVLGGEVAAQVHAGLAAWLWAGGFAGGHERSWWEVKAARGVADGLAGGAGAADAAFLGALAVRLQAGAADHGGGVAGLVGLLAAAAELAAGAGGARLGPEAAELRMTGPGTAQEVEQRMQTLLALGALGWWLAQSPFRPAGVVTTRELLAEARLRLGRGEGKVVSVAAVLRAAEQERLRTTLMALQSEADRVHEQYGGPVENLAWVLGEWWGGMRTEALARLVRLDGAAERAGVAGLMTAFRGYRGKAAGYELADGQVLELAFGARQVAFWVTLDLLRGLPARVVADWLAQDRGRVGALRDAASDWDMTGAGLAAVLRGEMPQVPDAGAPGRERAAGPLGRALDRFLNSLRGQQRAGAAGGGRQRAPRCRAGIWPGLLARPGRRRRLAR